MSFATTHIDTASRAGRRNYRIRLIVSVVLLIGYVLVRNYSYIQQGMLKPNFSLIHKAYDFNFMELPLTLLGLATVCAIVAIFYKTVRKSLFCISLLYTFCAISLFGLRHYITNLEPQRLAVRTVRLETAKLKTPLRLLHISDIQSGQITDYEQKLFEQINALGPDIIINTGDFLQAVPPATFESEFPKLLELITRVNPRLGTYAVFGDTEEELYKIAPTQLKPLQMLSSRSIQIETSGGIIDLYGLSLYQSRNPDWALRAVNEWLADARADEFRILFGHAPDFALKLGKQPIDLCLAGHTHGGQIRLPWYGPLITDSEIPREWSRGFRNIGIPYLNVSAGAGSNRYNGLPPMRFNCPTEITLIELVPVVL